MKKNCKNIILMITVLSLLGLYGIPTKIPNEMPGHYNEKQTIIESKPLIPNSAESHLPIFIDGEDLANDWDDCDVVTGSGTFEEPYVIKDLEIDAGGSGSGIIIQNSTAYLNIVNCTVINSGSDVVDAGLRVENCENINISDCILNNNSYHGIFLYYSSNITLTGNTAVNTTSYGIRVSFSTNISLTDNTAVNNTGYGMYITNSDNSSFTGNMIANNLASGIVVKGSNNSILTDNTFADNSDYGIYVHTSEDITLTENTAINNLDGIFFYSSSNSILTGNKIANNPTGIYIDSSSSPSIFENWIWDNGDYDIFENGGEAKSNYPNNYYSHAPIFIDGDDPANDWDDCDVVTGSGTFEDPYIIEDLEIDASGSGSGIYIQDSTVYLNIVNCTAINSGSDEYDAGLRIDNCENTNISNCILNNNSRHGIYLRNSHYNSLTGNTAANNAIYGIFLRDSSNNTITDNNATNNVHGGILLTYSSYNIVTGNISGNGYGILLTYSSYNIVTGNTAENNRIGIFIHYSSNNIVTGNTGADNSENGIRVDVLSNNTVTDNTVTDNLENGIHLYNSDYNILTGNTVVGNFDDGIYLRSSHYNSLTGNMVADNSNNGIYLYPSSEYNVIFHNVIHENPIGISIDGSSSISISENWIWDNSNYDIFENGGEAKNNYLNNYYCEYNPLSDSDRDGLSDGEEFTLLHTNPFKIDTDNDNFLDGYEVFYGSDPLNSADFPMMTTIWFESISNYYEGNMTMIETIYALATQNTAFLSALEGNLEGNVTEIRAVLDELGITIGDTDYDGLDDLDEVIYGTSLTCADTDCDNLNDAFEVKMGTDPLNDDTDGDSWLDGIESAAGTNPLDVTDYPGSNSSPKNNNTGLIIGGIVGSVAIFGTVTMVFVKQRKKKV